MYPNQRFTPGRRPLRPIATLIHVFIILTLLAVPAHAAELDELSWLQRRHLDQQVEQVDELARLKLGTPVRGNLDDLELLQRIIYRGLIRPTDVAALQALGAVLGNVMVADLELEWKVYIDGEGRSRAACLPDSDQCLFPITMLSRRMEVGLLPDVQRIYADSREMVESYRRQQTINRAPR